MGGLAKNPLPSRPPPIDENEIRRGYITLPVQGPKNEQIGYIGYITPASLGADCSVREGAKTGIGGKW